MEFEFCCKVQERLRNIEGRLDQIHATLKELLANKSDSPSSPHKSDKDTFGDAFVDAFIDSFMKSSGKSK